MPGPMAWTVEDCALLLQAMAGHDPADPASADRPVPDFTADLGKGVKGLRIGVVRHFFETDNPVSPATLAGIDDALDVFEHLGAEISDVTLSPLADYHACGWLIMIVRGVRDPRTVAEDALQRLRRAVPRPAGARRLHPRHRLRAGDAPPPRAVRGAEGGDGGLDILVTASQASEAPKINEVPKWATMEKPSLTMPFNVTGYPAMSVCTGFGEGGLPVSMQLVAKPFAEATLFQAGHAYEMAVGLAQAAAR